MLSPDTIDDVYNLKVQVGAEHAFPVVALDVPVAEVSPLARHFAEFEQEEASPATAAGASTLPVADEPAPGMDEGGETDAISQHLSVLSPVAAAADAAMRPQEFFKVSDTGNSARDNDAAPAGLPSSGVKETSVSSGVDVCGVTETGIADTTAAFGVVDLSALMAAETAGKVQASPDAGTPAPTAKFHGPRRSLSPGWKGYINADASSASPDVARAAGTVGQAGVSLQALQGDAKGRTGAADPYASSPPGSPTLNVCSANKKDCVIS